MCRFLSTCINFTNDLKLNLRNMKTIFIFLLSLVLFSCSTDSKNFHKEPLDELIQKFDKSKTASFILYDMDELNGNLVHKYKVLYQQDTVMKEYTTDWLKVSDEFFQAHINDMGMELASKKDNQLTKKVNPVGFNNFVNNPQYGSWKQQSDGTSFWEFYGQYTLLSSLVDRTPQTVYHVYETERYSPKPYYGSGNHIYGSNSPKQQLKIQSKPSFKERVQAKVQKSSTTNKTSGSSWGWGKSSSSSNSSKSSNSSSGSSWWGGKSKPSTSNPPKGQRSNTKSSTRARSSSSSSGRSRKK